MSKLPRHVACIMDGNGRWATARGLQRVAGHQAGAESVREVVKHSIRRGIPFLTLYAFSTENWSRPREEVEALMTLLGVFVEGETQSMMDNGVKLRIIGDVSALPAGLQESLAAARDATGDNTTLTLSLALNYGGRDEIVRACRKAAARLRDGGPDAGELDARLLEECLDSAGMPDPDLVVRTAGEMRLSNFLIWQAAYAEFYFTDVCWPDFSPAEYDKALDEFSRRVRNFGGVQGES